MAAYAALVSLMNIIHDIQHHHSPPISIHQQQLQSLSQTLSSLLKFLEASQSPVANGDEADSFEMRIADAAYAVEDVIETHLVDAIHLSRTLHQQTSSVASKSRNLYQDLQRVIDEMDLINQIAVDKETNKSVDNVSASDAPLRSSSSSSVMVCSDVMESHSVDVIHRQQTRSISSQISRFFSCFRPKKPAKSVNFHNVIKETDSAKQMADEMDTDKAVAVNAHTASSSSSGMDDVINGLMEKLMGEWPDRLVIPIVGMGGIGKTYLALNIYERKTIKERFDVCASTTISQNYDTKEILRDVLAQATNQSKEKLSERSEVELGTKLYQYLFGRRYLIIIDDMWSIDAWKRIQHAFPNDGKSGSRILVTTRLSHLSSLLNPNYSLQMKFLDEGSSWNLFSKIVFEEEICPPELNEIGKKIVENCRGLPLSIVVIGGILKKEPPTQKYWKSVRDNLTSRVNLDNDKHCLRLLKSSYNHLPVYLKPCFLYMGIFEEDDEIKVSIIIKLWVSEGFLQPMDDTSLETIARGYLKDLVDRNLIIVDRTGYSGNIKSCKIHDLLRDLCLNVGEKEGFHKVIGRSQSENRQCRRIVIPRNASEKEVLKGLQSTPLARSVICENGKVPECQNFGLLRTFHAYKFRDRRNINSVAIQYVNLRHLAVEVDSRSSLFSSLNLFWNLHTLIVSCPHNIESTAPAEIWKMCQLRHIEFPESWVSLPDPPSDTGEDKVVMENLQVLKGVKYFKCSEEVVKTIPNIKKLETRYSGQPKDSLSLHEDYCCVSSIEYLSKLESLHISIWGIAPYLQKLSFPHSHRL